VPRPIGTGVATLAAWEWQRFRIAQGKHRLWWAVACPLPDSRCARSDN